MPDSPELEQFFGRATNNHGESVFPQGRIVNMGLVSSRVVIASAYGPYKSSEAQLSLEFLSEELQHKDLLLADANFASARNMAIALRFVDERVL